MKVGFSEGWLMVLTVTIFAIAISLIVSWLIRWSKILTLIVFGQYDWNRNKLIEIYFLSVCFKIILNKPFRTERQVEHFNNYQFFNLA